MSGNEKVTSGASPEQRGDAELRAPAFVNDPDFIDAARRRLTDVGGGSDGADTGDVEGDND